MLPGLLSSHGLPTKVWAGSGEPQGPATAPGSLPASPPWKHRAGVFLQPTSFLKRGSQRPSIGMSHQ